MEKPRQSGIESFTYNETGAMEVTQQVMDSYSSGVVDSKAADPRKEE